MNPNHQKTTGPADFQLIETASSTVTTYRPLPAHLLVDSPTPADYGITNPKFKQFSRPQYEAIQFGCSMQATDTAMCLPTGVGKSLAAVCIAKQLVKDYFFRVLILTHALSLQDQLESDFEADGVATIRGRSNYGCVRNTTCEDGPYYGCRETSECPSNIAKNNALKSQIVSANYAYWLTINRYAKMQPPIGSFDVIIMDEAHLAYKLLSSHLTVSLDPYEFSDKFPDEINDMLKSEFPRLHFSPKPRQHLNQTYLEENVNLMMTWANSVKSNFNKYLGGLQSTVDEAFKNGDHVDSKTITEYKAAMKFGGDLGLLSSMEPADWVVDNPHPETLRDGARPTVTSTPIWPGRYRQYLIGNSSFRVYMSATLLPESIRMIGVSDDNLNYKEWPRIFPSDRNPVYAIPTVTIKHDTEKSEFVQSELRKTFSIIGRFHEQHKGIVHSVSYSRMEDFARMFRQQGFGDRVMTHNKNRWGKYESAADVLARHVKSPDPTILISPVISTGVDLPDDLCRFAILPKLPFQPSQDLVMKVRRAVNDRLYNMETIIELTQMTGRGSRHYYDWCVYYLLDAAWKQWFDRATRAPGMRPMSLVVQQVLSIPTDPLAFTRRPMY